MLRAHPPATRADVPDIVRLMRELAQFEKLPGPDGHAEARLANDLGRRFDAWVAQVGNDIVAYALAYETYSTFAAKPVLWLEDLYVTPRVRRSGIARDLMTEVGREASRRDCARVTWAVLDWNAEAIRFYEKLGATRKPWVWYEMA